MVMDDDIELLALGAQKILGKLCGTRINSVGGINPKPTPNRNANPNANPTAHPSRNGPDRPVPAEHIRVGRRRGRPSHNLHLRLRERQRYRKRLIRGGRTAGCKRGLRSVGRLSAPGE